MKNKLFLLNNPIKSKKINGSSLTLQPKFKILRKIKVAAVSYLNTKPLLYGIEQKPFIDLIELSLQYPSIIARQLKENTVDIGLVPVAAIPSIPNAAIISDYGIGADGKVASVSLFSKVPLEEVDTVYLDYQSRTSVKLAKTLLKHYWKKEISYEQAPENYIELIGENRAGVIIGDRALIQNKNFPFIYDLAEHWKNFTGLPFTFAAWVTNKELPKKFIAQFNEANAIGLSHLDEIIQNNPFPLYDLRRYYTENINFKLKEQHVIGMNLFLDYIKKEENISTFTI